MGLKLEKNFEREEKALINLATTKSMSFEDLAKTKVQINTKGFSGQEFINEFKRQINDKVSFL